MQVRDSNCVAPRRERTHLYLQEHQRLHREYAHDWSVRALVGLDGAIRRAAHRVAGWFGRS